MKLPTSTCCFEWIMSRAVGRRELLIGTSSSLAVFTIPSFTLTPATQGSSVSRPSYNTGTGFFTLSGSGTVNSSSNTKIYDANGNTFRPRGVNRNHYDDGCDQGIWNSKANCERYVLYW